MHCVAHIKRWTFVRSFHLAFDLTDVTLPDEDTNSILTDNANRTIPGNMAMHVATWLPNLKLVQVAPAGGQI